MKPARPLTTINAVLILMLMASSALSQESTNDSENLLVPDDDDDLTTSDPVGPDSQDLEAGPPGDEGDEIELPAGVASPPVLLEMVTTDYPPQALEDGVQADVLLRIVIDDLGLVEEVEPIAIVLYLFDENDELYEEEHLADDDSYRFVAPAVDAVFEFEFEPARDEDGEPVPVSVVWRYGYYFDQVEEPVVQESVIAEPVATEIGNLAGRVLERGTRDPLPAVEVVVSQGEDAFFEVTDADGYFEFEGLPVGVWLVEIDMSDYQPLSIDEEVYPGERTEITYRIERVSYGEYAYEARADSVPREVSRQTLDPTEISRIPGNNGDAIRVVENMPGVARAAPFSGLIAIRGSAPENTGVFLNGIGIPLAFHFGGLAAVVNSDVLDELEFIPGAFSAEYGRLTGGVINMDLRGPRRDAFHGFADVDVFDTTLLLEGPITDKWSFLVSARRSYIDVLLPLFLPQDAGFSLTVAPRYWDVQSMLQFDPSIDHSFNLLFYASDDALEAVIEEPDDPVFRGQVGVSTGFYGIQLSWDAEVSESVSNEFLLGVGWELASAVAGPDIFLDVTVFPDLNLRETLEIRPLESLRLRTGLDVNLGWTDLEFRFPEEFNSGSSGSFAESLLDFDAQDVMVFNPAAFAEVEWEIGERVTVVPGVRVDAFDTFDVGFDHVSVDFRFATRAQITDEFTLKGAFGTFHQPPQVFNTFEEFGNPDLGPEGATH